MKKLGMMFAFVLLSFAGAAKAASIGSPVIVDGYTLIGSSPTPSFLVSCDATFVSMTGITETRTSTMPHTQNTNGFYTVRYAFTSTGPGFMNVDCIGVLLPTPQTIITGHAAGVPVTLGPTLVHIPLNLQ